MSIQNLSDSEGIQLYQELPTASEMQLDDVVDAQARHALASYGQSYDPSKSHECSVSDLLARTVIRHPSEEAKTCLNNLHRKMKELLIPYSDDTLEWLLGGSSINAYGGFSNVRNLRRFLTRDSNEYSSEQLIRKLETLLTAMAYRVIRANWTKPPFYPTTAEQQRLSDELYTKFSSFSVPSIGNAYPERVKRCKDEAKACKTSDIFANTILRRLLSKISVEETEASLPAPLPACALVAGSEKHLSWTAIASQQGIPIRATTSGTWPLSLAVACGLLFEDFPKIEYDDQGQLLPESIERFRTIETTVKILTGVLGIPTYIQGDFHSAAETSAGMHFFLMIHKFGVLPKDAYEQPADAFNTAVTLSIAATDDFTRKQLEGLPYETRRFLEQKPHVKYIPLQTS